MTALPLLLVVLSCGGDSEPVAEVAVPTNGPIELVYPGEVELTTSWKPLRPLEGSEGSPTIFVHLLDSEGEVLRTFDHRVPFEWRVGDEQRDPVTLWQSALVAPLEPGTYDLSFGLYEGERRWPLAVETRRLADEEYLLARLQVEPPPEEPPQLSFDGFHLDERSGDRQTLVRRWLEGESGRIELSGLERPLDVGLGLRVPDPGTVPLRLVLDEGAEEATVQVASGCTEKKVSFSGAGLHEVVLRLAPAEETASCAVRLETNFVLLDVDSFEKRSVSLERLTWTAVDAGGAAGP